MCGAGKEKQKYLGMRLDRRQGLWPKKVAGVGVPIYRCGVCGLVYANPMPLPQSVEEHYDVAPEAYWTKEYFSEAEEYFSQQIATWCKLTKRSCESAKALDIGAGIGKAMRALQRAGFEVWGIEPSPSFRERAIQMGVDPQRLLLTSVEEAEFPEGMFDFINFSAVVEHLADPSVALEKALRWLSPKGLMYVEVPSSSFLLARLVHVFYRLTGAPYVIHISPMHPPYHLYEFGLRSFLLHGERVGYQVVHHEYCPCGGYMPRWLIPLFNAVMRWTDTGMQLMVWLKRRS